MSLSVTNAIVLLSVRMLFVDTRVPILREEYKPPRDYRPSKWISNSALDVWYGNKSMVDIMWREFREVVDRIANRPVRSYHEKLPVFKRITFDNTTLYKELVIKENKTDNVKFL